MKRGGEGRERAKCGGEGGRGGEAERGKGEEGSLILHPNAPRVLLAHALHQRSQLQRRAVVARLVSSGGAGRLRLEPQPTQSLLADLVFVVACCKHAHVARRRVRKREEAICPLHRDRSHGVLHA
eukprot:356406-Chlamydomonas_euryale.AAC.1